MPLVEFDEDKVEKVPATGRVVPVDMRTALVQTRNQPRQSLITQAGGSIFPITVYKQLVREHDSVKPQALNLDAPYQQYEKINNVETRLQGDFSYSFEEEEGDRVITGTLILYPGLYLNTHDMFEADVGDGQLGLFHIYSQPEPLSWMGQACQQIQFRMVARDDALRQADLKAKTVEEFYYVVDFIRFGKNPVLISSLYHDYRMLYRTSETMISEYLRLFFSPISQTLMIPGQEQKNGNCYDPFLVSAVLGVLETTQHPLLRKVQAHNTDAQYAFRTTTIWDALLQMEPSHLHLACQQLGLVQKGVLKTRANYGGAYWAQIDMVVFPIESREDADSVRSPTMQYTTTRLSDGPAPIHDFNRLIREKDLTDVKVVEEREAKEKVPNIINVNVDDYYVFSKAFYEEDYTKMSKLEKLVWSVLNQQELDVPVLAELVRQSKEWDKLERFYYVPVLMILNILALRGPSI